MLEPNLPTTMGFAPWSPDIPPPRTKSLFNHQARERIRAAAWLELSHTIVADTPDDSFYFAGKHHSKLATMLYVLAELAPSPGILDQGLSKLAYELEAFVTNTRLAHPIHYDGDWGGVLSWSATPATPARDFGNTFYTDHHIQWGYIVHAAAVLARLQPGWLVPRTKAFITTLARDYAESASPCSRDFPASRPFDWFAGHS